jgi:hypothetical protein
VTAQLIAPRGTTTRWGGVGLAAAGVLLLAVGIAIGVPLSDAVLVALNGASVAVIAQLVQLAAAIVLAVGVHGEGGVVGRSGIGRTALIVFGAQGVAYRLLGVVQGGAADGVPLVLVLSTAWQLAVIAAVVLAAIAVLRARVLHGPARWALVLVAAVHVVFVALQYVPSGSVVTALEVLGGLVQPALLIVTGVVYAVSGTSTRAEGRPLPIR